MSKLNLTTSCKEHELIKQFLEENASEILADKINNGVRIEKDGKTLINKKTLDGFMKYASDEARKIAEKGKQFACVHHEMVFGWAIHYFEEDTIEGTLYNEDGSLYSKQNRKIQTNNSDSFNHKHKSVYVDKITKTKKEKEQPSNGNIVQPSLFDLLGGF